MRAAIYARVSTSDQNCEIQLRELTAYVQARSWSLVHIEAEHASGAKHGRPVLQKLLTAARKREIDVILVTKLDRFSRSTQDLLNSLQALESAGVRFIAIEQGIDTDQSNPISRLLIQMLGAIAQFERELTRERTMAGVAKYRQDYAAGRAHSQSGKNLPPHRPFRIFDRDEVVRLRQAGASIRQIAKKFSIGQATVCRALKERSTSQQPGKGVATETKGETAMLSDSTVS